MSEGASGLDLFACLDESIVLEPRSRTRVPTGLVVAIPAGYEGQIRPRSGLAFRHGVTVLNSPGTIDSDYRGELLILLINHGESGFEVRSGDRIAQLVIAPVAATIEPMWPERSVPVTDRAQGGFGSTGR